MNKLFIILLINLVIIWASSLKILLALLLVMLVAQLEPLTIVMYKI